MVVTLAVLMGFVVDSAPIWLKSLRDTIFTQGRDAALEKSKDLLATKGSDLVRRALHLDEKEQIHHLEQALKNAAERGLVAFTTLEERDQYRDILSSLMQIGARNEELLKEVLQIFTLSDSPDFARLNDLYDRIKGRTALARKASHTYIDVTPYLTSFFNALISELYADPYFRQQLSDVIRDRAAIYTQRALSDIVTLLQQLQVTLSDNYTAEQLARDIESYTTYLQRTMQRLKIAGVVPSEKFRDPELETFFIPVRVALQEQRVSSDEEKADTLPQALEQAPYLVLLGGPGSGKSTSMRYLAWSHAANQSTGQLYPSSSDQSLLPGIPLPLFIELRRLSETRRQGNNYDILTFMTEVILKRDGVEINRQMFKELLSRRMLLLLFDGLDEVATVDERARLVEEIEHFALSYPGNRMIVTSRPVGYDLARFSNPLFSHAQVLPFDEGQIRKFLQNWYTSVLGLSPIPLSEQQRIDQLFQTLQGNERLYRLAENPLLLTVITALHRYETLPDKRVLIYDRCADLLLETWAKLKGTHERWKDMEMVKEDQCACIAHLGFVLHAQPQEDDSESGDITSDATTRVMLQEIERFLKNRDLIAEGARRRSEAGLFIELMQTEAGLIVERGTDQNGEALYGFVHRTFQEYFAAVDVYERFQQAVDITIIKDYLVEHLHDPHWNEVTLLLLAKLRTKPITEILRALLQGNLTTRRSLASSVLQQDLFFACRCLTEEITVESSIVDLIISRLYDVIKSSIFPAQRREALQYFCALRRTRQYSNQSQKALGRLMADTSLDFVRRIEIQRALYINSSIESEEQQNIIDALEELCQVQSISLEQIFYAMASLSTARDFENSLLLGELSCKFYQTLIPTSTYLLYADELYEGRPIDSIDSIEQQFARRVFKALLARFDLSLEQTSLLAIGLAKVSPTDSEEQLFARNFFKTSFKRSDLSIEQACSLMIGLAIISSTDSEEQLFARKFFKRSLKRSDLPIEQIYLLALGLYRASSIASKEEQSVREMFKILLERSGLSIEQICLLAIGLYGASPVGSEEDRLAGKVLRMLLEHSDFPPNQTCQIATVLYIVSYNVPEEKQFARNICKQLLACPDLSADQICKIAATFYTDSVPDEQQFAANALLPLAQNSNIPEDWSGVYYILRRGIPRFDEIEQTMR